VTFEILKYEFESEGFDEKTTFTIEQKNEKSNFKGKYIFQCSRN
jgi:hypothetical protein